MPNQPMPSTAVSHRWELEVVRGREVGRRYPLEAGELFLGNALAGARGVNLADQETNSPRRMAGRQASLAAAAEGLTIRDLESPGGTFVNRQRLLSGQARTLQPGDVVQVGGVQLRVVREPAKPASPKSETKVGPPSPSPEPIPARPSTADVRPGSLAIPYTVAGGSVCRTWDDFLTLAAQRWGAVRDELVSGRLGDHLKRIGRADLLPRPDPTQGDDERLDAWLARLPATRSSAPELDVHPETLVVRARSAGGTVKQTLRITNVGYRLLQSRARVEPAGSKRIRIPEEFSAKDFLTIDQTDLPVEIDLPDAGASASLGTVVIESNGGSRRIEVRFERPAASSAVPDLDSSPVPLDPLAWRKPLGERISSQPLGRRLAWAVAMMVGFRLLVLLAGWLPIGAGATSPLEPRTGAIAAVMALVGGLAGAAWGARGGSLGDAVPAGFAAAIAGIFAAAVGSAVIRSVESVLGGWAASVPVVLFLWALLGGALALASWIVLPAGETLRQRGARAMIAQADGSLLRSSPPPNPPPPGTSSF